MVNKDLLEATTKLVEVLQKRYEGWEGAKQFGQTPERLERMFNELCWTEEQIESELNKHFDRTFKHRYDMMLVMKPVEVWTLCPHHLVPCRFEVTIGYIPSGWVLGLSKFARIADTWARRPVMQEEYSTSLADLFMDRLKPKGVAVYTVGVHGCMTARGVRQHGSVVTSVIRGAFETQSETRAEFMALCRS